MRNNVGIILSYLTVYIVWGSTYLFIRMAVVSIPPFYLVAVRFLIGGAALLLISAASGKMKPLPGWKQILSAGLIGILMLVFGNGLVSLAEKTVDSYIAALIVSCTPLAVAFYNKTIFRVNIGKLSLAGIIIGVFGVGLLLYKGGNWTNGFTPGVILVLLALLSWSFAMSISSKLPVHTDNMINSGLQMAIAGAAALVFGLFVHPVGLKWVFHVTPLSWFSMGYLVVLGTLAFYTFSYLLKHEPAIRVSSYAIVNPLIAVLLGLFAAHEKPVPLLLFGMPLILIGIILLMYQDKFLKLFLKIKQ